MNYMPKIDRRAFLASSAAAGFTLGFNIPFGDEAAAQTPVMPKSRYKIMTNYMPKVGSLGLDMMYRTCTVQTNLDFSSEADMVKKLRVSLALQPMSRNPSSPRTTIG